MGIYERGESFRRDLAFITVAVLLHGGLLLKDPALIWGPSSAPQDHNIPVELVASPTPSLAPVPAAAEEKDTMPAYGQGEYRPEEARAGAPEPRPEAKKPEAKPKKPALSPEMLRELALKKAERKERLAAERAERVRLAQEQARIRAEQVAERKRRKVELESRLAMLPDPDDALQDALAAAPAPARASRPGAETRAPQAEVADPRGRGGSTTRDLEPAGGGPVQDGGGVAWSLEGPVGNRRLAHREVPACPDWVSERGLDLVVQIRFQVLEDGTVQRAMAVRRTSGFPELDRVALDALGRWRFEAVRGSAPDTWGVVTFHFTMG
ncbi:MAG: TonB family protein [Elusimicrobiota bacterium]|jgi:TonB family protein